MTTTKEKADNFAAALDRDDFVKSFTIRVTDDHIKRARPNTENWCMVALAISEAIPECHTVRVNSSMIRFSIGQAGHGGLRYAFPSPAKAIEPIQQFDMEAQDNVPTTVKPFTFVLAAAQAFINPMIQTPRAKVPRGPTKVRNTPCRTRTRWNGQPRIVRK